MEHKQKTIGEYYRIRNEKIRKSVKEEGRSILEINIEYPFCEEDTHFAASFNSFYGGLTERFCRYCENKAASAAREHFRIAGNGRPFGESFRSIVSYDSEMAVSVLSDVVHFRDGKSEKVRFAAVWDPSDARLLSFTHFLPVLGIKSRRELRKRVGDALRKIYDTDREAFELTEEGMKRYAYSQNPQNYFLTPAGVAFWYDCGTVSRAQDVYPTVVLPYQNTAFRCLNKTDGGTSESSGGKRQSWVRVKEK